MANNTLSFAATIINPSKRQQACFQGTIDQYQSAVNWLVPIANQHWKQIQQAKHANEKQGALERLVHATEKNPTPPHAEFDELYPNFPCYLRRAACTTAIGEVSSWRSNHENWVEEGRKGQEPKLSTHYHPTPTFYKTNMWQLTKIGSQVDETELMRDPQPSPEEQAIKHEARELAVQIQEKASSERAGSQRRDRYAKYRKARQAKKDKQEEPQSLVDDGAKIASDASADAGKRVARDWGSEGDEDFCRCRLKVWDGKQWVWCCVSLRPDQAWKLKKMSGLMKRSAPTIEKRGNRWFLRFAFKNKVMLTDAPVGEQRICAVDLGVNTPATCCVMEPEGTVVARAFIDFPTEKGRLNSNVNRLRKAQGKGSRRMPRKWRRINHLNEEISRKTARAIVDLAVEFSCTHVVFEHLGSIGGRKRGSRKWRLHLWRARDVQVRVERHAHLWGVRVARVCAWGTSRLAFDGSGRVKRGREIAPRSGRSFSYGWVEFSSGKLYAADLNAAYNIGARFFIREFLKASPVRVRSAVLAKVPCCVKRSSCVLADLISLVKAIRAETSSEVLGSLGLAC